MKIFSCLFGLNATSVTYTFSAGTTIVAAEHNTNMDDLEAAIDGISLTTFSVTATSTELNYLDGSTPGTAVASKALVVDSNKDLTLGTGDFTCTNLTFTGTFNTDISTDEIGYLNGVTSAIQTQLDAKVENLGDLSITATASEINQALDGISANVTDTNLNTLTGAGDASSLHRHNWDYDSGWFTANLGTLYTKAHSIALTFPTDPLELYIVWRASSGGSYIVHISGDTNTDGSGTKISHDGTNVYLKGTTRFAYYIDSSGNTQNCGNGEIRIFARERF